MCWNLSRLASTLTFLTNFSSVQNNWTPVITKKFNPSLTGVGILTHTSLTTCHVSIMPKAKATDPLPANFPVCTAGCWCWPWPRPNNNEPRISKKKKCFPRTTSYPKFKILRPMSFHFFSLRNLFVIDGVDYQPF